MLDGVGYASVQTYPTSSNMFFKRYPTLSGDVGRCLTSVVWCWIREGSNVSIIIKRVEVKWRETDCVVFLITRAKMLDDAR